MLKDSEPPRGAKIFTGAVIILIAVYIVLRFGVPWFAVLVGLSQTPAPMPGFALGGYMTCVVVGTLVYMSAEEERWRDH